MKTLRAIYETRGPNPHELIRPVEVELPALAAGQALVEVLAAPINPSDVLTITGEYGMLPPLPAVGGNEGVGRIAALGPDTAGPPVGQHVLLPVGCGTWSNHVVADAARLMPLPNQASAEQLSMLTVNPPTAALMLSEFVELKEGDWVIQNVANSGVGNYLIQLAKRRGLKTVNLVRRESAVAGVQALGGDVVLVDGDDIRKRVRAATDNAPIRLGIDAVGGLASERIASCLAESGTVVNYGAMSGEPCVITPRSFIFNDIALKGFWLARWFRTASRERQMALYKDLAMAIAKGELHTAVHARFPVEQIGAAVAAAREGGRDGKILVVPQR